MFSTISHGTFKVYPATPVSACHFKLLLGATLGPRSAAVRFLHLDTCWSQWILNHRLSQEPRYLPSPHRSTRVYSDTTALDMSSPATALVRVCSHPFCRDGGSISRLHQRRSPASGSSRVYTGHELFHNLFFSTHNERSNITS
jgi:hypothetical protein